MLKIFTLLLLISISTFANSLDVQVRPIGLTEEERQKLQTEILQAPNVQSLLRNKTYRVLALDIEDTKENSSHYVMTLYNYTDNEMYEVLGPLNRSTLPQISKAPTDFPATPDEFDEALKILTEDPQVGQKIRSRAFLAYEPMPAVAMHPSRSKAARLINVGLTSTDNPKENKIVGVDLMSKEVVHFPAGAPDGTLALEQVCGLPNARQRNTAKGVRGSAEIEIRRGGQLLWKFILVRPSASSGRYGSGVEIRNLYYKGKKVLTRAHTPILNVKYAGDRCGPFRDWTYSENPFTANGTDLAPGIRRATSLPQTIFDNNQDLGNFRGVAIYSTGDKVMMVTELAAAWYRYVSKFELYDNGTIKPIFEFSSVENSCVCFSHNHHVYWRFDFDLDGIANSAFVFNGDTFTPLARETSHVKSPSRRFWRLINRSSGLGYHFVPGPNDGVADSYSIADAWLLRYSSTQIDDSNVRTSTRAGLNAFLTGQSTTNQDLVFWYSGHFLHSQPDGESGHSAVGPTLSPLNWTP